MASKIIGELAYVILEDETTLGYKNEIFQKMRKPGISKLPLFSFGNLAVLSYKTRFCNFDFFSYVMLSLREKA